MRLKPQPINRLYQYYNCHLVSRWDNDILVFQFTSKKRKFYANISPQAAALIRTYSEDFKDSLRLRISGAQSWDNAKQYRFHRAEIYVHLKHLENLSQLYEVGLESFEICHP